MIGCAKGPSYSANKGVRSLGKKPVVEKENLRLTHLVGFETPEVEALFQVGVTWRIIPGLEYVVGITPSFKPWKGHLEGEHAYLGTYTKHGY